jgi:hypothetical protein
VPSTRWLIAKFEVWGLGFGCDKRVLYVELVALYEKILDWVVSGSEANKR